MSWQSLPQDVRRNIVAFVPAEDSGGIADMCRFGTVSRGCRALAEEEMRRRYRRRPYRRLSGENSEPTDEGGAEGTTDPPAGWQSWTRFAASRRGLLPADSGLLSGLSEVSGDKDERYIVQTANVGEIGAQEETGISVVIDAFEDSSLGLHPDLLRGMREYGVERPSSVQRRVLPPLVARKSLLVVGTPATGRTFAHMVGVLQNIDIRDSSCQALVVAFKPERASAVRHCLRALGIRRGVATRTCRGGEFLDPIGDQAVIGTPDELRSAVVRGELLVDRVGRLIFDYAQGLALEDSRVRESIYEILRSLPSSVAVGVFTAELTDEILRLASNVLPPSPTVVRVRLREPDPDEVIQEFYSDMEE